MLLFCCLVLIIFGLCAIMEISTYKEQYKQKWTKFTTVDLVNVQNIANNITDYIKATELSFTQIIDYCNIFDFPPNNLHLSYFIDYCNKQLIDYCNKQLIRFHQHYATFLSHIHAD